MEELNSEKDVFSHQWDENWGVREHFSAFGLNLGSAGQSGWAVQMVRRALPPAARKEPA